MLELNYPEFRKIPRLSREIFVTEKIDGTNALIFIEQDGQSLRAGSRTRWITPKDDNHGFAKWAEDNHDELLTLGPGHHYGEWWGQGINRGYGLNEKRFSLFNVDRWTETRPACCHVVPTLYRGLFDLNEIQLALDSLALHGSTAAPGAMNPEGIIIYHTAGRYYFKKTLDKDDIWKGKQ